jgi:hypothetical protein
VEAEASMGAACVRAASGNTRKLTGKSLVQLPKREGRLHLGADVRWFTQHLRAHIRGKGEKLP